MSEEKGAAENGHHLAVPELRDAADVFFQGSCVFSSLGGSSGFSGSSFARVEDTVGSWCLRRWPDGFDERSLRFIHRTLMSSRAGGFTGVPGLARTSGGDTIVQLDGYLFDAQEWLPGAPTSASSRWEGLAPNQVQPLPPQQLATLGASLAFYHVSTTGLISRYEDERMALTQRLNEVSEDVNARYDTLPPCVWAQPDVFFVSTELLRQIQIPETGYWPVVLDLVVEVLSPSERPGYYEAKLKTYLAVGVRMVLMVSPPARSVTVYTPGGEPQELRAGDTLDGGDVLRGFSVPVDEIFGRGF
ncbi:MAG: Uma2 family endonuclease [Chloroflexota bacterium]|nr:Uma2 family endonuclease [Chloroflexota bacterium]